jgi:N-acetyl-anhydromuramyl-L-alanine amidase AmpD
MESPEEIDRAEKCALWMSGKNKKFEPPKASAHFFIDSDSIVQGVRETCIAWHAPGANHNGIGIEHAGRARQTRDEWLDEFGRPMLDLSAQLVGEKLCVTWDIQPVFVDAKGLLEKPQQRGITTHAAVTEAFKRSTHTDPGKSFPMDWYLERVRKYHTRERRYVPGIV